MSRHQQKFMVFVVTKLVKDISLIELVTILMHFGGFSVPSTSETYNAFAIQQAWCIAPGAMKFMPRRGVPPRNMITSSMSSL